MSKNVEAPTKVVQTEVPASLYERFTKAADARQLTIKEAARVAITEFVDRHEPIDPDDPLFDPLVSGSGSGSAEATSERVDDVLYGDQD